MSDTETTVASARAERCRKATGSFPDRGQLVLAVLDWALDERLAGRRVDDHGVAKKFGLTLPEAIALHDELEEMGELG